jgi:O-antigen ligase
MFTKSDIGRNLQPRNILLFFLMLISVTLLVVKGLVGLIFLVALLLLLTGLVRPKYLFLLVITLFAIEAVPTVSFFSYAKIVGVVLMGCLILRFVLTRERMPKDDFYGFFLLFMAGGALSFLVAKNINVCITTYVVYISLFAFYVLVRYFVRDEERLQEALNYLIVSSVIISSYFYLTGSITEAEGGVIRTAGGMGDANNFAGCILAVLPLAVYRAMNSSGFLKLMFWGCVSILLILVVLSGSRGGLLGLLGMGAVFLAYYGGKKRAQVILVIFVVGVLAYYFIPDEYWFRASTIIHPEREKGGSISTRLDNYKAAVNMIIDHPFIGVGISNFRQVAPDYGLYSGTVAHNTYLEVLTGGGLLHFIPFCLILVSCWRKSSPAHSDTKRFRDLFICLRASLVSLLITLFFLSDPHKKILWFLFAIISSAYYIAEERRLRYRTGNQS